uniref:Cysteine and tyrosine-rich protein 1 n=1 Tax=Ciona savignyi TaxID=51511 RepID=H2YGZ7_CIOSA
MVLYLVTTVLMTICTTVGAVGQYCDNSLDCPDLEICCSNDRCCDIASTVGTISVAVIVAIVVGILLCIGGCIAACVCCCKRNQQTVYHNPRIVTTTMHTTQPLQNQTQTAYAPLGQQPYPQQTAYPSQPAPYTPQQPYPPQPQPQYQPQPSYPSAPQSYPAPAYEAPPATNPNYKPSAPTEYYPTTPATAPPPYSS